MAIESIETTPPIHYDLPPAATTPGLLTMDQNMAFPNQHADRLNPYFLAESLPVELVENVREEDSKLRRIWTPIETALADPDHEVNMLDGRVESAYMLACEIAETSGSVQQRMQAELIVSNIGLIALRVNRDTITSEDIHQSYDILTQIMDDNRDDYRADLAKGILAEMVAYGLIARAGDTMNVPFVASPREESSPWSSRNHDLYTVDDATTIKLPLQVRFKNGKGARSKSQNIPKPFILKHYSENFLSPFRQRLARVTDKEQASTNTVAELIADEADGRYDPESMEGALLSDLSRALIKRINNHRLHLLGLKKVRSNAPAGQ